jgi:hypothetical protein
MPGLPGVLTERIGEILMRIPASSFFCGKPHTEDLTAEPEAVY